MPETRSSTSNGPEWQDREPYHARLEDEEFDVKWKGECYCGKIQYQLSRAKPLATKFCHCKDCQRMHGAPFQWAAIFHKTDINFTNGVEGLGFWDSSAKERNHHPPCKVYCDFCRTPIMDEGRNMILLFPTLIKGIETPKGREAFKAQHHMFYPSRVVDFHHDGVPKWKGLDGKSEELDDEGKPQEKA